MTEGSRFTYTTPVSERREAKARGQIKAGDQCVIKGCRSRPVYGYDTHLCQQHRAAIGNDLMKNQIFATCKWPGCAEKSGFGPLKMCVSHRAIVVNACVDDHWVINAVAEMRDIRPEKRTMPTEGFVYFLLSDGAVKIGWTSELDQRLKQYSPGARILAVKPGTKADESALHKKFAHIKTHRKEWFSYSPQVMEEVQRTIREHGEPPRDINEPLTATRIVGPRLDNYIGGKSKSA